MQILFVHGMGRTSASAWWMLRQLQQAGHRTATFDYAVSLQRFDAITRRLCEKIQRLSAEGDLVLVGHSLGGVLLRAALQSLPPQTTAPLHLFLLGSPVRPSRMAQRLRRNPLFRLATTDCGALLASADRMAAIDPPAVRTTGIAGTKGIAHARGPFAGEANDGVVTLAEVSAPWLTDQVRVPVIHTLLPSSRRVGAIILERLAQASR